MNPEPIKLHVAKAEAKDIGKGIARFDPEAMEELNVKPGDIVKIEGDSVTAAKALPHKREDRGKEMVRIDGMGRRNAGAGLDESVRVSKWSAEAAERLTLKPLDGEASEIDPDYLLSSLKTRPVTSGDVLRIDYFGTEMRDFSVSEVRPGEPALVTSGTELQLERGEEKAAAGDRLSYEYIGGLEEEIRRVREMVELPMKFPQIFKRLGVEPPKGVLLHGPPGTGKTLLARALAEETNASFFHIGGPEIIGKYYGESEARLRTTFEEAKSEAPSIIFIDEIDAIASKREELGGEKQVEKRVVAQLLSLMDGLESRGEVIVIGATNISDTLDPALRRPGRFDREIEIGIPDKRERAEILSIHTRSMPLGKGVDLEEIAAGTHGYVGADLEALTKEAAMASLRRIFPEIDFDSRQVPYDTLSRLEVSTEDFKQAFKETSPSALREVFTEIPGVSWDDVGGLEEVKLSLQEAVQWPLKYGELFELANTRPPKGILLYGPPGTGKTLLAKAVANESQANFISLNVSQLLSKWVGGAEKRLSEVFKKARQSAPCIVFFDEIDSLAPTRGGQKSNDVVERIVSQMLVELDGTEELHDVVVIGATNRPDIIDPALLRPGRFDLQLECPPPDEEGREAIFAVHAEDKPLDPQVDLAELAKESEGLVGADIEAVCKRASMRAIRRAVEEGTKEVSILQGDFKEALTETRGGPFPKGSK